MLIGTKGWVRSCIIGSAFLLLQSCGEKVAEVAAAVDAVSADCLGVAEPVRFEGATRRASSGGEGYSPDCPPGDEACQAWRSFRSDHPYPYQAFAGKRLGGGMAVVVLSEPPPTLSREQATKLVTDAFADRAPRVETKRWMIASDGYVDDLVVRFAAPELESDDILSSTEIRDRLAMLHLAWYGTTCGGDVETIGSGSALAPAPAPNLEISARELKQWLEDPATLWTPIEKSAAQMQDWRRLAETGPTGAYLAQDKSLVLLTFPLSRLETQEGINGLQQDFRRFAVSSDAVAGALTNSTGQFALVGRARTRPFSQIAPLRFETFALLAAHREDQLSQSYERTNPLSGRTERGQDWAPIYLSDPLYDTEFGALLNVTDQMLKAWSEAGRLKYLYFDYPLRPSSFPFDRPLSHRVRALTQSLQTLYNWNTSGSAATIQTADATFLVGRRLGALPITYGSDAGGDGTTETGHLLDFEDQAYSYFAALGDANLARVVQYTLIYQALLNLSRGPSAEGDVQGTTRPEAAVLVQRIGAIIDNPEAHLTPDGSGVGQAAQAYLAQIRSDFPSVPSGDLALMMGAPRTGIPEVLSRHPELFDARADPGNERASALVALVRRFTHTLNSKLIGEGAPLEQVRSAYEAASSQRPVPGWIRTPSNVVSWGDLDEGNLISIGGHSLKARAVAIKPSEGVDGVILRDGEILFDPSRSAAVEQHAAELARAAEHRKATPAQFEAILSKPIVERPRLAALAMDRPAARPAAVARLGRQTFNDTGAFLARLRTLKENTPCCRIVGRDGTGRSFIVETNAKPPPLTRIAGFGDNASLGMYIKAGKGQPADVIVIGQNQAHVDALLAGVDGAAQPRGLIARFRQRFGGSSRGQATGDHLITNDLNGRPGSLMAETGSGHRGGMRQLFALRSKAVRNATVQELSAAELQRMTGRFAWDAGRDEEPLAVRVSFPPQGGSRIDGFNVIAGFRRGDPNENAERLRVAVGDVVAATRDKDIPLAVVQISIKNSLRGATEAEVGRIVFEIRAGSAATQFTLAPRQRGHPRSG